MTTLAEYLDALGAPVVHFHPPVYDPRDEYELPEPWDDRPFEEHAMTDQLMDEADRGAFDD